ncbi:Ankyrin repeat [Fusarium oxysporum f. sp. vasinfectum]|nr:Ankyrin repeat [Fusarium oxysporum f. sp. vasinfectum]
MEDELSNSEDYYNYVERQQMLLWEAVEAGQEDTARSLLRHDFIRIHERDDKDRTLLSLAVGLGHTNIVECLLDRHDIDVNLLDGNDNLPLNEAAGHGHETISRLLLGKDDIDVNLKDGDNRTPLIKAASNGHGAIVSQLLEKNDIDVNLGNDEGDTPLVEAAWNGHETVVRLLLGKTDIQPNARGESGITPLYAAAAKGHKIVVGLLLDRDDIELNPKMSSGETPLFAAANNGHESVTKLLLRKDGIDLNVNCHGDTPLSAALDCGHKAVSELLLNKEGNELDRDGSIDRGYFLLSKALDRGLQDIASKILIAKISRNVKIPIGRSPLSWAARETRRTRAAECDSISVVSLLLESSRIDVNRHDLDRRTPLSIAADTQNNAVVSILVTRDTVTLHSLVREGNLSSVEILLDNRYDINTKNDVGQSSLHVAVDNNRFGIAVKLLERGANVNAEDHSSMTPLRLAVQQKRRDFAELLLDYSASTKGIMFHGWRSLYEEFSPQHTLRITERASGNRRVDFLSRNNLLANEPETGETIVTWSFAILKSLNTKTMMYAKTPDLQDAMQMKSHHCYTGQAAGAYAVAYFPILQLDLSKGKINWEGCGVGWSMGTLRQDSGSVRYFSMLQESGSR